MNDPRSQSYSYSTRDLLIGVALFACIVGAYVTFGLLGAAAAAAFAAVLLIFLGHRFERRLARWAGRILMVAALCTSALMLLAVLFLGIGPIYSRDNWPSDIGSIARLGNGSTGQVKVSCLENFIDSEYVWRQPLPSENLSEVVTGFELVEVRHQDVPPEFFAAFPFHWRPIARSRCEFFATPEFPIESRGPDGDYYSVMYDHDAQRIYIWYKSNF